MRVLDMEQGAYEWHMARQGRVTGTSLKDATGTPRVQHTLRNKLIAERMTEIQPSELNTAPVIRGRDLEPIARARVSGLLGIEFQEVGMLVSDDLEWFGFSPDGVVFNGGEVVSGIEIKCPSSAKHVEYLRANTIPPEYLAQVTAPFLVSDAIKSWYFCSFDDRNYERPLFIHTVTRDNFPELESMREKLREFLASVDEAHISLSF